MTVKPFWLDQAPEALTREQWESLCDGCARCCLNKLEDIDSGDIVFTNVACFLLDEQKCQCTKYAQRRKFVPGCLVLTPQDLVEENMRWFPATCAYRLIAEGQDLPDWHPLKTGDPESTIKAGMSVQGRIVFEQDVDEDDLQDYVIDWVEY